MRYPRPRHTALAFLVALLVLAACSSSPIAPSPPTPPTSGLPQVLCPADIAATSLNGGPVAVNYQLPAAVGGTAPVTVTCSPAPGAMLAPGATPVTCRAIDAVGLVGACGFTIRVTVAPRLRRTQFMAFGDSLTAGVIALAGPAALLVTSPTSYPDELQLLLSQRYAAQTVTVDNEGLGGETAAAGLTRLKGLLSASRPEVVLLLEGANDLNDSGVAGVDATAQAMEKMIAASAGAGAVPLLATLPPQRPGGARTYHPEAVVPYNSQLASVAASTGTTLVDLYAAFGGTPSADLIGPDGLHPTAAGYQRMADAFFAAIKATLETPPASVQSR